MDITIPPLPAVAPEVLRVAEHRHKQGLMYPYIYHVLTKVIQTFICCGCVQMKFDEKQKLGINRNKLVGGMCSICAIVQH